MDKNNMIGRSKMIPSLFEIKQDILEEKISQMELWVIIKEALGKKLDYIQYTDLDEDIISEFEFAGYVVTKENVNNWIVSTIHLK